MDAKAFLASQGKSIPLHPVTIRLVDPADPSKVADASAVLRFVPEPARLRAIDAAAESLAKIKNPSSERRAEEEVYHFLVQAVRQTDAPTVNLFDTVDQCKSMVIASEAQRIHQEYERYVETHFPQTLTQEEIKQIAEDAKQYFFDDLLRRYGYWRILRALPSLAVIFGASLTYTSSPTPSSST